MTEPTLQYDPTPWLTQQTGQAAVRARRSLGIRQREDEQTAQAWTDSLAGEQERNGSFEHSPMKTAGVLILLDDLAVPDSAATCEAGADYLLSVLESQPGYEQARNVQPGSVRTPCDLCGFFGPYDTRNDADAMAEGARELNFYREYEPLVGPKTHVRTERRSSLDRAGPPSCYSWGLIPLCSIIEALCRSGRARDPRLSPALDVLMGVQRESGGWCRNLGGHPRCSSHAIRVLGVHPELRDSEYAVRGLELIERSSWRGLDRFALLEMVARFELPVAARIIEEIVSALIPKQRKNGSFGTPLAVEKVGAVLKALRSLGQWQPWGELS